MSLRPSAVLQFLDYAVDDVGWHLHFVCADPGPGEPSDYYILLTDSDLSGVTTMNQALNLIQTKCNRKFRAAVNGTKLDALIGQTLTV